MEKSCGFSSESHRIYNATVIRLWRKNIQLILPEALQEVGKDYSKVRSSTLGMITQMYGPFRSKAQEENNFRNEFRFAKLESEVTAI